MKDEVHCRVEHAYPGRPTDVWHNGRWQQVTALLNESQIPSGRLYQVICEGTQEFWLRYDPDSDSWQVSVGSGTGNTQN